MTKTTPTYPASKSTSKLPSLNNPKPSTNPLAKFIKKVKAGRERAKNRHFKFTIIGKKFSISERRFSIIAVMLLLLLTACLMIAWALKNRVNNGYWVCENHQWVKIRETDLEKPDEPCDPEVSPSPTMEPTPEPSPTQKVYIKRRPSPTTAASPTGDSGGSNDDGGGDDGSSEPQPTGDISPTPTSEPECKENSDCGACIEGTPTCDGGKCICKNDDDIVPPTEAPRVD